MKQPHLHITDERGYGLKLTPWQQFIVVLKSLPILVAELPQDKQALVAEFLKEWRSARPRPMMLCGGICS